MPLRVGQGGEGVGVWAVAEDAAAEVGGVLPGGQSGVGVCDEGVPCVEGELVAEHLASDLRNAADLYSWGIGLLCRGVLLAQEPQRRVKHVLHW